MAVLSGNRETMNSMLSATNQNWKMNVFYISLGMGAFLMFGGRYFGDLFSIAHPAYINIAGVLIGLISFFVACVSIKCPDCKDKWFWRAVSKSKSGDWLFWLKSQISGPACKQGANNGT
tara:strand:+ start:532 stop:888 length:357 start_codon:yes stop_codon:yes gene_type:complete